MSALKNWPRNRLLLALPSSDLTRLLPALECIGCEREQVLIDVDSPLDYVFFPDSGVVSAVAVYADGRVIEMATIGREGCTGMQAAIGAESSFYRLLVQIPGRRGKDDERGLHARDELGAVVPNSDLRVSLSVSRAGPGVGSLQRSEQRKAAVGTLAADDA
jgi:hypothetical protein